MAKGFKMGDASSPLNFKVVGNPQPVTPKENTIWVSTDVAITSYIFDTTQPTNPTEGMVYLGLATSTDVEFNAIKKNGINLRPASCKQYAGGTWLPMNAYIYIDGNWVQFAKATDYLFKDGMFNPRLCPNGMQTSSYVWIHEGCIHSQERSVFYFNDLIDLTQVSRITVVHVGSWNASSNFAVYNTSGSEVAKVTGSTREKNVTKTIDVSGLTGLHKLGFYGTGGYATGQFTFDLNHVMIHP